MTRRTFTTLLSATVAGVLQRRTIADADAAAPLSSWNDGPAKSAFVNAVRAMTDSSGPHFVAPGERLATFDQDGTLWVEHPIYTQVVFALDRVVALAPKHPQWKTTPPFDTVLSGDKAAMAKFTTKDLEAIVAATHTGMDVEAFAAVARTWIATAKHPRWNRLYTELVYQPMVEAMEFLRSNGFALFIVTGGGQDFVRVYGDRVYQLTPPHIVGSAPATEYTYGAGGKSLLMREAKLLLNDNLSGKPEDIYLFSGRRPQIAFGNSTGDRQMCEYTTSGRGLRFAALVLHDDVVREYAYGPAAGLPNTRVGTFTQALHDEAKARSWSVISMKSDWKRIFSFET